SEPINAESRPIPDGYDFHLLFSMSGTAPVRMAEILFDPDLSDYGWQRKFEVQPGQKYKEFQENGRTSYLFENIQARQTVPFASEADLRSPVCSWYWAPQMREWLMSVGFPEDKPINLINAAACTVFYSYLMDPVENKRGLRSTLRGMGQGLDNLSIRERAISLMRNLRSKVKTLSELPEIQHQKELKSGPEAVLKRGWGTSEQLNLLGFHVLRENGLSASWVMAIDREENRLLDPNNLWQYDNMLLLVLDERGEPIYLNPGSTYTPVGLPPWLQSSKALVIFSTKERLEWTGKFFALPSVNPEKNSQIWKSVILPGVDSDDFDVSFEATGNAASHWKSVLGGQHAGDLAKGLKPLVEREGFLVRSASGDDLLDPWKKMAFKFQGTFEHEGGRKRVLSPFLFLRTPFVIPPSWPENRTFAIHLPMTTLIQAEARIPWKGEAPTAKELDPTQHENYFGKVSWSGEMTEGNKGKELLIRLKIEVSSILGAPSKYGEMKEFTGWIREALGRGVFAPQI
ncbi:MAG: hypothetical protein WAT51_11715, partial [Holophaga sp.]